jgi:glycosyltransferase involved in cell wall biosynthesis
VKKLVIISHTDHQRTAEGTIVGWGPTITEINYLAQFWDEVVHVGCFDQSTPKGSSLPYIGQNIRLVPIPPFGGRTMKEKLSVITLAPTVITKVLGALKGATHVQMRMPMGIGIYLLPFFAMRDRRRYIFWVKYANNWMQRNAPKGYAIQRWMLSKNIAGCKTTINGFWKDQPSHCISFENPSLRFSDLEAGKQALASKNFTAPFNFVFIGRLEDEKGVSRILEAIRGIDPALIGKIHFIGDGKKTQEYLNNSADMADKIVFHGYRTGDFIRSILASSHFFLLPTTASEGFPKVVAEASCYGCIPVVSDTSSIPHYVKDHFNGFVWEIDGQVSFQDKLTAAINLPKEILENIAKNGGELAEKFTLERYFNRLSSEIFKP